MKQWGYVASVKSEVMAGHLSRICTGIPRLVSVLTLTRVTPQFYSKFDVDIMDEFTSQLMERKIGKWDQRKRKNKVLIENSSVKRHESCSEINIQEFSVEQLRLLFQNLLDNEDSHKIIDLIKLSVENNKSPPVSTLMNILSICAQKGDKDTVLRIQEMCRTHHPKSLEENSDFKHFLAKAVWVKGDVSKALEMFEEVYRENVYLRRRIRLMLKYLIGDLVTNGSEAALGNMIGFSERILQDFQDLLPLTCVWQACFLSEWFTDQCVAVELLEKHSGLCKSVINRIPLLEILLKYKMKQQYSNVLASLLDYQFHRGDLLRCSEIIHWAVDNEVLLPKTQYIRMVNLLINQKMETPLSPTEKKSDDKAKYDYKF